ncbi:hypothetical protein KSX_90850 [Ktedonospora formicarum]|uniref:HTH lysR-type domain-containing protein n=2 Tax=Ktedonospora formicarum TaxID=2778364 RepID=A0A8J3MW07_9CHLR|nr:hypothetical protein KSX_90850 [Ktedonospora formicarum]
MVYRSGTVSGAARALFLTQPAVTQHIAALETALGEPLFQRTPRRMIPTTRGKALYSQVVQALETLERVTQEAQNMQVEPPLLRCGSSREYFSEVVLPHIRKLPYRLWLQFSETPSLIENLEREKLDIVLASQQIASHGVEYHKVDEEHFLLVGPPDLKVPGTENSIVNGMQLETLEQWLSTQKWISYGVELPIIRRFWQQCFGKRPTFQAKFVIPDLRLIIKMIEEGEGLSVLPDYLCRQAREAGRLQVIWEPSKRVTNELWLAYRRIDRNDTKIRSIRRILQQTYI